MLHIYPFTCTPSTRSELSQIRIICVFLPIAHQHHAWAPRGIGVQRKCVKWTKSHLYWRHVFLPVLLKKSLLKCSTGGANLGLTLLLKTWHKYFYYHHSLHISHLVSNTVKQPRAFSQNYRNLCFRVQPKQNTRQMDMGHTLIMSPTPLSSWDSYIKHKSLSQGPQSSVWRQRQLHAWDWLKRISIIRANSKFCSHLWV